MNSSSAPRAVSPSASHRSDVNYSPVAVDKWELYADDASLSFPYSSMEIKFVIPRGTGKRLQQRYGMKCIV